MPVTLPNSLDDLGTLPPIPAPRGRVDTGDYKTVPVDPAHPLYGETLVELRDHGIAGAPYYHRDDGGNAPYGRRLRGSIPALLARETVAAKLVAVNRRLAPLGVELYVWDAYRPLATQQGIWDFFEARLRQDRPDAGPEDLHAALIGYVSDPTRFRPDDPATWPTHLSGASVDLTLRDRRTGRLLDMGADFDQMDPTAHAAHFEGLCLGGRLDATDHRLLNRRLLHHAMAAEGFTGYPQEYWHFDWGNQMYQMVRAALDGGPVEPAWYGAVSGP